MRLENKIAIVTGAAKGIGLAVAEVFVKEGAVVFMADIDDYQLKLETDKLNQDGIMAHPIHCDVGNTEQVEKLISDVISKKGRIDILVNNAAVAI